MTVSAPRRRSLLAGLACLLAVGVAAATAPAAVAEPAAPSPTCTRSTVPVSLPGESGTSQTVATQLCVPDGARTVLLLVSGATYGSTYWDFPYEPERYSMVRAMNEAGIATLNLDRVGIGASSHPLSAQVTIDAQAFVLHQVVSMLRSGTLGDSFEHVVIVGHSMGSAMAEAEVAKYADVDGIIATGLGARKNLTNLAALFATFVPAVTQPRFAGQILDPGYLTTLEGTRGSAFYYRPNADPAVIAADDATRETVTAGELGTIAPFVVPGAAAPVTLPACATGAPLCSGPLGPTVLGPSSSIHVPTLFVLGQQDALICGPLATDCSSAEAVKAQEQPLWGTDCFGVRLVPDAGHDLTLQRNAPDWYATVTDWVRGLEAQRGGCPGPVAEVV